MEDEEAGGGAKEEDGIRCAGELSGVLVVGKADLTKGVTLKSTVWISPNATQAQNH